MLGGYSLELRFCGVVLVVGTISFHWTSSFGAIDLSTLSCPKEYNTLLHGRKGLGSLSDISLFRRIGYAV